MLYSEWFFKLWSIWLVLQIMFWLFLQSMLYSDWFFKLCSILIGCSLTHYTGVWRQRGKGMTGAGRRGFTWPASDWFLKLCSILIGSSNLALFWLIALWQVFHNSVAREDWGWEARIPLASLVEIMITNLRHGISIPVKHHSIVNAPSVRDPSLTFPR